jgi:hypothetical protein
VPDDLLAFTIANLQRELDDMLSFKDFMVQNDGIPDLGITGEAYARADQPRIRRAELRLTFLNDTVRPYLGTAGPTGRIAEQQLRLLGAEFADRPGYRPEWSPEES